MTFDKPESLDFKDLKDNHVVKGVSELARIFGVTRNTIYAWIKTGGIPEPFETIQYRDDQKVLHWRIRDLRAAIVTGSTLSGKEIYLRRDPQPVKKTRYLSRNLDRC